MVEKPPADCENVPVPANVSAPVLCISMVPALSDESTSPLLVRTPPFTFMVMFLLDETVTAESMAVLMAVVVTAPPLRFNVVAPAPADFENVSDCPAVGAIEIAPPVVVMLAVELSGEVIVSELAPPPESIETEDAPEIDDPAPKIIDGAPNRNGPPPTTPSA